jgi:hypothetical protein
LPSYCSACKAARLLIKFGTARDASALERKAICDALAIAAKKAGGRLVFQLQVTGPGRWRVGPGRRLGDVFYEAMMTVAGLI